MVRKKIWAGACALFVVMTGGGIAYAATSAGSAPVPHAGYACVNLKTHTAMTILDSPSAACPAGTTSIVLGAQGPAGKNGTNGTNGTNGAPGLSNLQAEEPYGQDVLPNAHITQSSDALPAGQATVIWAACPSGEAALGGGFRAGAGADANESDNAQPGNNPNGLVVLASEPTFETGGTLDLSKAPIVDPVDDNYQPNAWAVTVDNTGTDTQHARVAVICAKVATS